MRYTYAKFENFYGFYEGLGKTEVEINFEENDPTIIMLLGKNGGGKTTLLSSLQPYPLNNDNRPRVTMIGHEGRKELHIKDGDFTYKIEIHYTEENTGNKCFFAVYQDEEWKELNPNGGVRTYENLLEEKLGLTKEYFVVGKIGSNVTNFIDMSASDRKKFIGKFAPSLESYAEAYTTVTKKLNQAKKLAAYLADELKKIPDKETCNINLSSLEKLLKELNEGKEKVQKSVNIIDHKIQELNLEGEMAQGINPFLSKVTEATDIVESFENEYKLSCNNNQQLLSFSEEDLLEKIDNYKKIVTDLESDIKILSSEVDSNKSRISSIREDIENNSAIYESSKKAIESLKKAERLIDENKEELKDAEVEFNSFPTSYHEKFETTTLETIGANADVIKDIYSVATKFRSVYSIIGMDGDTSIDKKIFNYKIAVKKLPEREKELTRIDAQIAVLEKNAEQALLLERRPHNCKIDTCDFISNALKYKNVGSQLDELHQRRTEVQKRLDSYSNLADTGQEIIDLEEKVRWCIDKVKINKFLKNMPFGKYFASEKTVLEILKEKEEDMFKIFSTDNIHKYVSLKINIEAYQNKINDLTERIENTSVDTETYDRIEKAIQNKQAELSEYSSKLKEAEDSLTEKESDLSSKNGKLDRLEKVLEAKKLLQEKESELVDIKAQYSQAEADMIEIKSLLSEKSDYTSQLNTIEEKINDNIDKIDEQKNLIAKYDDFKERIEETDKSMADMLSVKEATDPTKGIPLLRLKNYFTSIRNYANNLIQHAFNGEIEIQDFIVDKDSFYIPLRTSTGQIKNDVTEASQGEVSLAKTAISVAIINEVMGRYNILCLDEVDSTMDATRRQRFVEVVREQITALGCEQVFVISHNRDFMHNETGLILFKNPEVDINDASMMSNKKVIKIMTD